MWVIIYYCALRIMDIVFAFCTNHQMMEPAFTCGWADFEVSAKFNLNFALLPLYSFSALRWLNGHYASHLGHVLRNQGLDLGP